MSFDQFLTIFNIALPSIVAIAVPYYTMKENRKLHIKLKEVDVEERENDRRKAIEKEIMIKSIDTLQKSFFYTRKINSVINSIPDDHDEEIILLLHQELNKATTYWDNNYCYLPNSIRDKFVLVSNLSAACLNKDNSKHGIDLKAHDELSKMFDVIKELTEKIMSDYNPLNKS